MRTNPLTPSSHMESSERLEAENQEAVSLIDGKRARHTLAISSDRAEQAGMTPALLQSLLQDES